MGPLRGPDSKGPPSGQAPDRDRPGRGEAAVSAWELAEMVGQVGQVKADHAPAAGWIWYDGSAPDALGRGPRPPFWRPIRRPAPIFSGGLPFSRVGRKNR